MSLWRPSGWPIRRPRIGHLMPYIRGDSLAAIRFVRVVLNLWWIDQNSLCTFDGYALRVHWDIMQKNGYKWRWTGRYKRHNGRRVEERVWVTQPFRVHEHTLAQALSFREKEYGGRRPHPVAVSWKRAARWNMRIMEEVKGSPGFRQAQVWQRMAADAEVIRPKVVIATLTDLPGWKGRCEQALAVNFPVAVLCRNMTAADKQWCRQRGIALW